ncbi:MAG: hypothetical protein RRZ24_08365 [Clostridia bacterium]
MEHPNDQNAYYDAEKRLTRSHCERSGGGRLAAYWLLMLLLNVLLAIFALYTLGESMQFDWTFLSTGTSRSIAETVFQLLLVFSPLILTLLLNRLLFRVLRGHRRFPRGTGIAAFFAVLVMQAVSIYLIIRFGMTDGLNGISMDGIFFADSISSLLP